MDHPARVLLLFGLTMVAVYCTSGIALFFFGEKYLNLPLVSRIILGSSLFGYGIFRFYRYYKLKKELNNDAEDSE